ncbi:TOBE domain-containing protein [Ottowia sp.]|uniref:TOBE domain-containing protein n=1 Tax=Ottowia sp. TaxID=1898956 RepID=UPI003A83E54E
MQTSARNQYQGKVTRVTQGVVNDEVELTLPGGQTLVAVITRHSSEALGLKPGVNALALVKASSVIVASDLQGMRFSARNSLQGTVSKVVPGAVNSEVVIDLSGGVQVAAIVTKESADKLGLVAGKPATALIKASSVILGVAA